MPIANNKVKMERADFAAPPYNERINSMKILYVEDDAHASENLRLFLQATGHEGCAARTGEEALKLFSGAFDLERVRKVGKG